MLPVPAVLARAVTAAERAVDRHIGAYLRRRPGWRVTVVPYVGHGTPTRVHVRGRVVARRRTPRTRSGPAAVLLTGLGHYLSAEVPGEAVMIALAGSRLRVTSDADGYVEAIFEVTDLAPGWHQVTFGLAATEIVTGRALVIGPQARLGLVSDIDDTIIHTGLTRLVEALRTSLLVAEEQRLPIVGASALYAGLAADQGRVPVFYVSTGAWNLHAVLERFLARHGFPAGPMVMTDWGPGGAWLFREDSIAFKSRMIITLIDEHPQLRWVLVGDSGQHDPEAYAAVARARPGHLHAVYIREVPPQAPARTQRLRQLTIELAGLGVPMLAMRDSLAAAEHAQSLGLLDAARVEQVRLAVADSP